MPIRRGDLIWVEPPLASGGMAEVWRVINRGAEGVQNLAIVKRILLNYASNVEFKKMFIDEARITSHLHKPTPHPNIIQILDFQQFEDEYLLFLEYVNGPDIRKVLTTCCRRNIKFPIEFSLYIISEVLNGLYHAHNQVDSAGKGLNIIHRDISPQNILVSYGGDVKIIDWGIAAAEVKTTETVVGVIKGKYGYMSPEQANGEKLDPKTDEYSAAIVLWEMLTAKRLFIHENDIKVLKKIQKSEIDDPVKYNSDISSKLSAIVLKALSRKKEKRFIDSLEFCQALNEERNRIDPGFSRFKLGNFLKKLFEEEIKKDNKLLANAERKEPSEVPPSQGPGHRRKEKLTHRKRKARDEDEGLTEEQRKMLDLSKIKNSGLELDSDSITSYESFTPTPYEGSQKEGKAGRGRKSFESGFRKLPLMLFILIGIMTAGLIIFRSQSEIIFEKSPLMRIFKNSQTATGRSFELNSRLTGVTVEIAGKKKIKKTRKPLLFEDLRYQQGYIVEISKPGYETITDVIDIHDNKKYIKYLRSMKPLGLKGRLLLKTKPPGASIIVKGKKSGKITPETIELPLGERVRIELERHGYVSDKFSVKLEDEKKLVTKNIKLKRLSGGKKYMGNRIPALLKIDSTPRGASVYIESDYICKTPCVYEDGNIGETINVDLLRRGYKKFFTSFPLEHSTNYLNPSLVKSKISFGYINIKSVPRGEIYIDGVDTGRRTPISNFRIEKGQHTIEIYSRKKRRGKSASKNLRVVSGESYNMNLILK